MRIPTGYYHVFALFYFNNFGYLYLMLLLPVHPLQPYQFYPGWGHNILVEDSSKVQIINNRILAVAENGIEIKNSR